MVYLILLIFCVVGLTCFIPFCQFVYHKFFQKDEIVWLFSDDLFNRHIGVNSNLIRNREEMNVLWLEEMEKTLP